MASRFGNYEILHELKAGGMGSVLLGRRRGLGAFEQLVAIKTIRGEYANAPEIRAMFLDEASILARLNHPGIATVHDFGEESGTLYMAMEFVAGISFRDLMEYRLPPVLAARALADAGRGLHAAHELRDTAGHPMGVVHRDISPDNLMVGYDGHVKVIDFGIALQKKRMAAVTEYGTLKGKPPYMSPEQIKNESIDRRSDVFSLAVVLYELLTHRSLFQGDSIYAVARAVEHQEIRPPSQLCGFDLPRGLDAVVMAALDRDLTRRTPTAARFAEALEQVIGTAGGESLEAWADRELATPRSSHREWVASLVAGRDAPRPLGRSTGAVTQVASLALPERVVVPRAPGPVPPAVAPAVPPPGPKLATQLVTVPDHAAQTGPHRSLVIRIAAALFVLVGVATAVFMMRPPAVAVPADAVTTTDTGVTSRDAPRPDTTQLDASVASDARSDALVDAAIDSGVVMLDAGHRGHRDAGSPRQDAAVFTAAPDAAVIARGTGVLNIRSRPGAKYNNVVIDGRPAGVTPMLRKSFPAGRHTIELLEPDSQDVVFTQVVSLAVGAVIDVTPH